MSHFRHFAIAYTEQVSTAISNATMKIALQKIRPYVIANIKSCKGRTSKCNYCAAIDHYETVCRKKKAINQLENDSNNSAPPPS